jgi:hypothetical protein
MVVPFPSLSGASMFFVVLIEHCFVPTVFGPYCSVQSAIQIAEGPVCGVEEGKLQEVDETYYYPNNAQFRSCSIVSANRIGVEPK